MSPKKNDKLITEELKIRISKKMVKAFIDACDEKDICFEDLELKGWEKKRVLKAKKYLKSIYNRNKDSEKDVVDLGIYLSCSCTPKLDLLK